MLRIATSYILIVIVLTSPPLCLGEAASAMGARNDAGGCSCASHRDHSSGENPEPSDESEPDCLCQGAIVDVRGTELDLPATIVVDWLISDIDLSSTALSLSETSSGPPHQFPPLSTGRDVCILSCALLL